MNSEPLGPQTILYTMNSERIGPQTIVFTMNSAPLVLYETRLGTIASGVQGCFLVGVLVATGARKKNKNT